MKIIVSLCVLASELLSAKANIWISFPSGVCLTHLEKDSFIKVLLECLNTTILKGFFFLIEGKAFAESPATSWEFLKKMLTHLKSIKSLWRWGRNGAAKEVLAFEDHIRTRKHHYCGHLKRTLDGLQLICGKFLLGRLQFKSLMFRKSYSGKNIIGGRSVQKERDLFLKDDRPPLEKKKNFFSFSFIQNLDLHDSFYAFNTHLWSSQWIFLYVKV